MKGSGDDEVEDACWQHVDDAPIKAEQGDIGRKGKGSKVVVTSDGECVVVPRCAPEPKTPFRQMWCLATTLLICQMLPGARAVLRRVAPTILPLGDNNPPAV